MESCVDASTQRARWSRRWVVEFSERLRAAAGFSASSVGNGNGIGRRILNAGKAERELRVLGDYVGRVVGRGWAAVVVRGIYTKVAEELGGDS